jgi:hypothetical protein
MLTSGSDRRRTVPHEAAFVPVAVDLCVCHWRLVVCGFDGRGSARSVGPRSVPQGPDCERGEGEGAAVGG